MARGAGACGSGDTGSAGVGSFSGSGCMGAGAGGSSGRVDGAAGSCSFFGGVTVFGGAVAQPKLKRAHAIDIKQIVLMLIDKIFYLLIDFFQRVLVLVQRAGFGR